MTEVIPVIHSVEVPNVAVTATVKYNFSVKITVSTFSRREAETFASIMQLLLSKLFKAMFRELSVFVLAKVRGESRPRSVIKMSVAKRRETNTTLQYTIYITITLSRQIK